MRAVIQRVTRASVTINGTIHGQIANGLLVLAGIEDSDTEEDIGWLSGKIINMRIFNDENGVMNISLKDVDGDILLISQFTLHAGEKVGYLNVHLYRPFSVKHFIKAIPTTVKSIAVLDRCKEPGAIGEPLYMDVVNAFNAARHNQVPIIIGGRYGLASKEFNAAMQERHN